MRLVEEAVASIPEQFRERFEYVVGGGPNPAPRGGGNSWPGA